MRKQTCQASIVALALLSGTFGYCQVVPLNAPHSAQIAVATHANPPHALEAGWQAISKQAKELLMPYQLSMVVLDPGGEKKVNQLFQQSQFKKVFPLALQYAGQGNVRAQLEVGFMYEFGKGVKQDYQKAALWYFIAMRPNDYNKKPRERALKSYFGLEGQKVDYQQAAQWFRMAAELSYDPY